MKEASLIFLQKNVESLIEKPNSILATLPPPGSVLKLSPNATLIDLKKIREKKGFNKPIRIEEVTVVIDEDDRLKVSQQFTKHHYIKCFNKTSFRS